MILRFNKQRQNYLSLHGRVLVFEFPIRFSKWLVVRSPITRLLCDSTSLFSIAMFWGVTSPANMFLNYDPPSTLMKSGSTVYTEDQHSTMAFHNIWVDDFVRNLAVKNRMASSMMCRTGRPSRYTITIFARAFNLTFSWPIETLKRVGAMRLRWHISNLEKFLPNASAYRR